ncbi:hypothetical protein EYZ11_002338 [Aspergillus tanneri]|uniref:Checkpoint protein n=1 Tax=Aspergillus tanneri TaxID=1220188 RepID=A0A4S3JR48_9EURO|nr:uncharacterized protein ATNIH1004_010074 [Aspergillus tanneri]KAA8643307.1 hypothetical protein ATNIH1004_010074 [Aspergillus tanneri]THC98182.1 hypothetical protein EYZ11_002338 [Aspergillus tanneri]
MRFRSKLINIVTFSKNEVVRFTIIPDQGTQVWAQLPVDAIFDGQTYILESNAGVINLEVPVGALHRALRSAVAAASAQLRLTKKGNVPLLALTVHASSWTVGSNALGIGIGETSDHDIGNSSRPGPSGPRERETVITQEVPVKVLHETAVEGLHEPRCRDPDVHIVLPSLAQLKSISERFTKLAADATNSSSSTGFSGASSSSPKLELSANMHGSLKLAIATDALRISSVWTDLVNPSLDPSQLSQTEIEQLPSERMRGLNENDEAAWAKVRIDGRDWGRVLSVGRLSPKVVAYALYAYIKVSFMRRR